MQTIGKEEKEYILHRTMELENKLHKIKESNRNLIEKLMLFVEKIIDVIKGNLLISKRRVGLG